MPGAFNAGIATIFAREQLEACIIIGQYLALRQPACDGRAVGLLHTAVRPAAVAEDAVRQATALCERQYGARWPRPGK